MQNRITLHLYQCMYIHYLSELILIYHITDSFEWNFIQPNYSVLKQYMNIMVKHSYDPDTEINILSKMTNSRKEWRSAVFEKKNSQPFFWAAKSQLIFGILRVMIMRLNLPSQNLMKWLLQMAATHLSLVMQWAWQFVITHGVNVFLINGIRYYLHNC